MQIYVHISRILSTEVYSRRQGPGITPTHAPHSHTSTSLSMRSRAGAPHGGPQRNTPPRGPRTQLCTAKRKCTAGIWAASAPHRAAPDLQAGPPPRPAHLTVLL